MALSGVHVACGYVGDEGQRDTVVTLARAPVWSQTMAAAGTTASSAPKKDRGLGSPCFEIRASKDVYVAIGAAPNASGTSGTGQTARVFIPANETRNLFCAPGDKLAWVDA